MAHRSALLCAAACSATAACFAFAVTLGACSSGSSTTSPPENDAAADSEVDQTSPAIDSSVDSAIDSSVDSGSPSSDASLDTGTTDGPVADTGAAAADSGAEGASDAAIDSGQPATYGDNGCTDGGAGYHDMTNPGCWTAMDLSTLATPGLPDAGGDAFGYNGGQFDGRYVYFVPSFQGATPQTSVTDGVVLRYDTQGTFTAPAAWSSFDASKLTPTAGAGLRAQGFSGSTFDGRYLYLAPNNNSVSPTAAASSVAVVRYDTQSTFGSAGSWQVFDLNDTGTNAQSMAGATFDGRYVYLMPSIELAIYALVPRFDTQSAAGFTSPSAWSTYNVSTDAGNAAYGFWGGVFDGRYVNFIPEQYQATRYDTLSDAGYDAAASWSSFALTAADGGVNADGNRGGAFDGRYLYIAPGAGNAVVQFDTHGSFDDPKAWLVYENPIGRFLGAAFDGRFVYFIPATGSVISRYDTTAPFLSAGSWSSFDLSTTAGGASVNAFCGAVFDGRSLYLVPQDHGVVMRFDARTPFAAPPENGGSFY